VTFADEKLVAALAAQFMTPGPIVRSLLRSRLAHRLLGGTLARQRGQAGQFSAAVTVRAANAVGIVEVHSKL